MNPDVTVFLEKAQESLAGAVSEHASGRLNNCANRAYYGCYLAAVAALLHEGIPVPGSRGQWSHAQVQAAFVGQLVNRRKFYPAELRETLARCLILGQMADYTLEPVSARQAERTLRLASAFVAAVAAIRREP